MFCFPLIARFLQRMGGREGAKERARCNISMSRKSNAKLIFHFQSDLEVARVNKKSDCRKTSHEQAGDVQRREREEKNI